ncbi:MAG: two-component regulator propeller domain-containing protein [Ignavibacteria bacterium]|nr:two-component regulator propeller domain-containing protein [Ignavibacteria bacterium]
MFQSPFNCNLQFIWYPSVKSWIGAVLLILSLSLNAAPQLTRNYAYRYFTSRDGLVQMQVQCAFQDRDGYLWFGTKGGVSRFDGSSFKNYSHSDGIPVGEMLAVGEWGYKKMFFYHYSFQFLHENDSLESVLIPDSVIFHRHDFQGIPLNENEILLVNLMNKKTIQAGQNIHRHLLWNKKTRKFTTFNGIGKKILAYNEQFIVTSDALYKRKGVSVQKMYSFPNKYITARVDWESGLFYMYNQETYSIDKCKVS